LSTHSDIRRRLKAEVHRVLGDRPPQTEDVSRLRYVEQVIKESMRLYPPAWIISRRAIQDDEVGGYRMPAGAIVFASPYVTHRHPAFWDNPEGFDPDRFEPGGPADALPHFAYFPFGGGPRQCIGNSFAMLEMVLVVSTVIARCQLDLVPGQRIALSPQITLRPSAPILMTLKWGE
jgi:cytochrome P450